MALALAMAVLASLPARDAIAGDENGGPVRSERPFSARLTVSFYDELPIPGIALEWNVTPAVAINLSTETPYGFGWFFLAGARYYVQEASLSLFLFGNAGVYYSSGGVIGHPGPATTTPMATAGAGLEYMRPGGMLFSAQLGAAYLAEQDASRTWYPAALLGVGYRF